MFPRFVLPGHPLPYGRVKLPYPISATPVSPLVSRTPAPKQRTPYYQQPFSRPREVSTITVSTRKLSTFLLGIACGSLYVSSLQ